MWAANFSHSTLKPRLLLSGDAGTESGVLRIAQFSSVIQGFMYTSRKKYEAIALMQAHVWFKCLGNSLSSSINAKGKKLKLFQSSCDKKGVSDVNVGQRILVCCKAYLQ